MAKEAETLVRPGASRVQDLRFTVVYCGLLWFTVVSGSKA